MTGGRLTLSWKRVVTLGSEFAMIRPAGKSRLGRGLVLATSIELAIALALDGGADFDLDAL